jgi:glutamate racemase
MSAGEYDELLSLVNQTKEDVIFPTYEQKKLQSRNYIVMGCLHFPWVNKDFFASVIKLIKTVLI